MWQTLLTLLFAVRFSHFHQCEFVGLILQQQCFFDMDMKRGLMIVIAILKLMRMASGGWVGDGGSHKTTQMF